MMTMMMMTIIKKQPNVKDSFSLYKNTRED